MSVEFRDDAEVVNGTAGTSVIVPRPSVGNGDVLIAMIAEVGTGTITAPAGWTLIDTIAAATNVTLAAYRKVAASEGSSWTWTLGSSARNWGWVGAFSGVNTANPVYDSGTDTYTTTETVFAGPIGANHYGGICINATAAVRTASGVATTWTWVPDVSLDTFTERADMSTNAGAGTDIAGAVGTLLNSGTGVADFGIGKVTASQSQSQAAIITVALRPAMVRYNASDLVRPKVEMAFGADPDADPTTWTWTDVSTDLRADPGVTITKGRPDEKGRAAPTTIEFRLKNPTGKYTPENPNSTHWPNVALDTPVRISVPYGYDPPTQRAVGFVDSFELAWDVPNNADTATCLVKASGRLRILSAPNADPIHSALYRALNGPSAFGDAVPAYYWPCEDGSNATQAANVRGIPAMGASGSVAFAAESTLTGSDPLPTLATNAKLSARIPSYAATGAFCVLLVMKIPASPGSTTTLVQITTTGTARTWQLRIQAGAPDNLQIRALNAAGTQLLSDVVPVTESDLYPNWVVYTFGVGQVGADIAYTAQYVAASAGTGMTGTLAGHTHGNITYITTTAAAPLDGAGVGHYVIYTDPAYDRDNDPVSVAFSAMDGNSPETPWARFQRLCTEEGIPQSLESAGTETLKMGPQSSGTLRENLDECEDTDQGFIHDGGRDTKLVFVTRRKKYNATPSLVLDMDTGELVEPFQPVHDDQRLRNASTVTRKSGSSASYAPTTAARTRRDDREISLDSDARLYEIAGWRVRLGTAGGLRYPAITFDLRATPDLAEAWLETTRVGTRIQAVNLPSQHGPVDVDGFLESYTEFIDGDTWTVTLNTSPASPYDVPVVEGTGAAAFRPDTGGSDLTSSLTSTATSFSVDITGTALWTTTDEPFDINIGGEQITVGTVTGSSSPQTFANCTRSVNGVEKSHAAGAVVSLWKPRGLAL